MVHTSDLGVEFRSSKYPKNPLKNPKILHVLLFSNMLNFIKLDISQVCVSTIYIDLDPDPEPSGLIRSGSGIFFTNMDLYWIIIFVVCISFAICYVSVQRCEIHP
jgi:hypothetical protein